MCGKIPQMLHPPVLPVEKMCVPLPPECIYPRQRNIVIREMVLQSHMNTIVSRSLTSTKTERLSIIVSFALESYPASTKKNAIDWCLHSPPYRERSKCNV